MGVFTDRLELIQIDGDKWETGRDLEYHLGYKGSDLRLIVLKGYITDLASVPWPATLFISKSGDYNPCAVLHDDLYSRQGRVILYDKNGNGIPKIYSRKDCDEIFLESMLALKVNPIKARIMYTAVRVFGQVAWNNYGLDTKRHKK